MNRRWTVLLGLLLVGCGTGSKYVVVKDSERGGPSVASEPSGPAAPVAPGTYAVPGESRGEMEASAPSAAAKSARGADSEFVPRAESRPGLGTAWGETRSSHIREVYFRREATPFAEKAFFYNDRRGVDALVSYHRSSATLDREVPTAQGAVLVSIRGDDGRPFEMKRFADRTYVVGSEGARYSIVLRNRTGHRMEVVASVDGLDVLNGRPASTENRGYLLVPYGTVSIDGFRKNEASVAAFRFSATDDSYAERTGKGRNVGVIGLAFFRDANDLFDGDMSEEEIYKRDTANPFPNRWAPPPAY